MTQYFDPAFRETKVLHSKVVGYIKKSLNKQEIEEINQIRQQDPIHDFFFQLIDAFDEKLIEDPVLFLTNNPINHSLIESILLKFFSNTATSEDLKILLYGILSSDYLYSLILAKLYNLQPALKPVEIPELSKVVIQTDEALLERILSTECVKEIPTKKAAGQKPALQAIKDIFQSLIWRPAFGLALAIIIVLFFFGKEPYKAWRASANAKAGLVYLKNTWHVSSEDLRPPGKFEPSLFSVTLGAKSTEKKDPAVENFEKALQWDAKNRQALHGLATYWYFTGQLGRTDSLLKILIQQDSLDYEAWNLMALIAARKGDIEGALKFFQKALKIHPDYPEAAYNRALVLQQARRLDEARQAWQAYLKIDNQSRWAEIVRRRLSKIK